MKSRSFNLLFILTLLLSLLGGAVTVTPARAASIVVNTNADNTNIDGLCTLREAIINANDNASTYPDCTAGSGTDTITFAADYTITLTSGSQLPAVNSSITINGNGATKTIIQANAAADVATYRVFEVTGTGNLTLNSLTVRHGRCNSACATSPTEGGGILNSGTLTVNNSTISDNIGLFHGGGIRNSGTLTVTNSMISSNKAGSQGGGIYNTGNAVLAANSTISGNDSSSGNGGGISNDGTMDVTNSIISGNHCLPGCGGGGGVFNSGTFTISNSTISGNEALNAGGGGIFTIGGGLTVTNSLISGNKAYVGGGIRGEAIITNSTISGNSANSNGGGMEHVGLSTITNSTFSGNTTSLVGGGGGIYNLSGALNLVNTIIAGSTNGDCVNVATIGTNTNNLIEDGTCSPALSGNPFLGPLANNGGFTQTHALLPSSPAIDKGDAATCAAAPVSGKDQRGVTRPLGAGCDIGAFELNTFTSTFTSQALQDGRLLESSETSNVGGSMDNTAPTFILGDNGADRQYRSILHFDTSALPDNAVITKAVLAIKRQGITGSDPFLSLGLLQVDMRKPDFGAPSLELSDFNAAPAKTNIGSFSSSLATPWHRAVLNNPAERHINLLGSTQFRLYFVLDDNDNNSADFIRFYSGDSHTGSSPAASRPKLIITYTLP